MTLKFLFFIPLTTALITYSWVFEKKSMETLQRYQSEWAQSSHELLLHKQAEKNFKTKQSLWKHFQKSKLFEPTPLQTLQSHIQSLGCHYSLTHVTLTSQAPWAHKNIEKFPDGTIKNLMEHGLTLSSIHLDIESPYDQNIFQFMESLETQTPGLFMYSVLTLQKTENASETKVICRLTFHWVHKEPMDT